MLPTTKLFKAIDCPFYDATKSEACNRPYCHFNHAKPGTCHTSHLMNSENFI